MQELHHNQLAGRIEKMSAADLPRVCLIHGQEMLVDQSRTALVNKLLGEAHKDLNCDTVEGVVENIPDLLEKMNTFGLLPGPKIVVFNDAKLFEVQSGNEKLVENISDAYADGDLNRAANLFRTLCGRLEIDFATPLQRPYVDAVNTLCGHIGSEGVDKLRRYCLDKGWSAVATQGQEALQRALEKGFPKGHHLIMTVNSKVHKNRKLYKQIRDGGMVIDCSVPLGERHADKIAQQVVLRQILDRKLAAAGMKLAAGAFQKLCELTSFDPRLFGHNVQKLIDFAGSRDQITTRDIDSVLRRTKIDPVFELTNAVANRDLLKALFQVNVLLTAGLQGPQILAALVNQIRKLLVAKDFTRSQWGQPWRPGLSYSLFQKRVMPGIQDFDRHNLEQIALWDGPLSDAENPGAAKRKTSGVVLAPNPKNAYPVFQTVRKSEKFSLDELITAMQLLNQGDLKLKSSPQEQGMVLKKMVMTICGSGTLKGK